MSKIYKFQKEVNGKMVDAGTLLPIIAENDTDAIKQSFDRNIINETTPFQFEIIGYTK